MTQDEIRAIALEVAKELLDEPLNIGQAEHYTDFATHFLAAITAKAEPVGMFYTNGRGVWYQAHPQLQPECIPLYTHPAIEPAPSAWWASLMEAAAALEIAAMNINDPDSKRQAQGACDFARNRAKQLYAAIEPAPQQVNGEAVSMTQAHAPAVGAAPILGSISGDESDEEFAQQIDDFFGAVPLKITVEAAINQLVAALQESKGWMRDYADAIIRGAIDRTAAPLPDEVREIVERLREVGQYAEDVVRRNGASCLEAAEMIERLARQVHELSNDNAELRAALYDEHHGITQSLRVAKQEQQSQRIEELEAEVARLSGELSLANRTGDHLGMRVRDLKAEVASLRVDAERYRALKVWLADPSDKFDGVIGAVRGIDELDAAIDAARGVK